MYHVEHGAKVFGMSNDLLKELEEKGWRDTPFPKTNEQAVKNEDADQALFDSLSAEIDERVKAVADGEAALADERAEFEAEKSAFNKMVGDSLDNITSATEALTETFSADPESMSAASLYQYGKAIGAPVHHKNNSDSLIQTITGHINASQ